MLDFPDPKFRNKPTATRRGVTVALMLLGAALYVVVFFSGLYHVGRWVLEVLR